MQCGKELPDDANFCLKCGKPLKEVARSATQSEPQWEYCEIDCKEGGFMRFKSYFVVNAVGGRGVYVAVKSTTVFNGGEGGYPYRGPNDEQADAIPNVVYKETYSRRGF
jgi:hypothetical protein